MPLACYLVEMPHAPPDEVPCGHVSGVASNGKSGFALEELRFDRCDHTLGDLILDRKDICHREIVAFGPQMCATFRIDELYRDAQPLCRIAHAPMECVLGAEYLRSFCDIDRPVPYCEGRTADDHAKPSVSRECSNDIVSNAIGEVLFSRLLADNCERQYCDQWPRKDGISDFVLAVSI